MDCLPHGWSCRKTSATKMDADFSEIHALSCEKGWCAIRDEAQWQLGQEPEAFTAFVEKLGALASHFERAMVTFLDMPAVLEGRDALLPCGQLALLAQAEGTSAPARIRT